MKKTPKPRGFAAMSVEQRTAIARLGGQKVSKGPKGRKCMSERGRNGGLATRKKYRLVKR